MTLTCQKIEDGLKQFAPDYFDGLASGYMLHNFTPAERAAVFPYIARVIKSGGFYINVDKYAVDDTERHKRDYSATIALLDRLEENGYPQIKLEWIDHYEKDDLIKFTHAEQQKLLTDNGFMPGIVIFKERIDETFVAYKK